MTQDQLINILAQRHWERNEFTAPWADLTEHDRRASRAIVAPILADLRAIAGGCGR